MTPNEQTFLVCSAETQEKTQQSLNARALDWPYSEFGWMPLKVNQGDDVCGYPAPRPPCPATAGLTDWFAPIFTVPSQGGAPKKVSQLTLERN